MLDAIAHFKGGMIYLFNCIQTFINAANLCKNEVFSKHMLYLNFSYRLVYA